MPNLWGEAETMKAKIDFEVENRELKITRYYGTQGFAIRLPLEDLPEVVQILLRFIKEA